MLTHAKRLMTRGGGGKGRQELKGSGRGGGGRVWKVAGGRGMTGDPPGSTLVPKTSVPYSLKPPPG